MRVLLFESDIRFVAELKDGFRDLGFEIDVVADAERGLRSAKQKRPDLILLSADLPTMNGYVVCKKIRKDLELKDIPLVLLSGEANAPEIFKQHQKLRTRADVYLGKPVAFDALIDAVSPFVSLDEARSAAAEQSHGAPSILDAFDDDDDDEDNEQTREFNILDLAAPDDGDIEIDEDSMAGDESFEDQSFDEILLEEEDDEHEKTVNTGFGDAPKTEVTMNPWDVVGDVAPDQRRAKARIPRKNKASESPRPVGDMLEVATVDAAADGKIASLESRVAKSEADLADAKAKHQRRVEELEKELKQAQGAQDGAQAEVRKLRAEMGGMQEASGEAELLRSKLNEAKLAVEEVAKLRTENAELRAKSARGSRPPGGDSIELRSQINQKDKEILNLEEKIHTQQRDLIELRDKGLELERNNATLDGRIAELEGNIQQLESGVAGLEKEKQGLEGENQSLGKKLSETSNALELLRQKSEEEIEDLTKRLKDVTQAQETLEVQKAESEENLSAAEARIKLLTETRRKLEGELQEKVESLDSYARSVEELHEAMERAAEICTSLRRRDLRTSSVRPESMSSEEEGKSPSLFPSLS